MSQYFGFLLVVIATGWLFTGKTKSEGDDNSPALSRRASRRQIIISSISFFLGLQFHSLIELFQTDFAGGGLVPNDATEYMTWVPDELEKAERRNRGFRKKRKQKKTNSEKKKKKVKPLPRYHDSNYTKDFKPLPWSLPKLSSTKSQSSEEFMADYIALKRKHDIPLPWEQDVYKGDKVTLPRPIIGLNIPKSATLTMSEYFHCAGISSTHTTTQDGRIGICMMENHLADKPPLDGCNTYKNKKTKEIKPIEVIFDIGLQGPPCYYASLHDGGLENIAKHYSNGTIMLVTRNSTKWFNSFDGWGSILKRWGKLSCGFDGSIEGEGMDYWSHLYHYNNEDKRQYWIDFYEAHTQKIRQFALKHLSLTYVEVELENEKMAEQLEFYTGVQQSCVQVCHPGPQWIRKHDTTSKCHPPGEEPPEIDLDLETNDADDDYNRF